LVSSVELLLSRDTVGDCWDVEGFEDDCIVWEGEKLKSLVVFRRVRLGGGHPATSSSELDEASIAKRLKKNDSWGKS
jgi:hypothetical protein